MSNDLRTKAGRFFNAFDENTFTTWQRTGQASPHAFFAQMVGVCLKLCKADLARRRIDRRSAAYRNLMALEAELNSVTLRYQEALTAVQESCGGGK